MLRSGQYTDGTFTSILREIAYGVPSVLARACVGDD